MQAAHTQRTKPPTKAEISSTTDLLRQNSVPQQASTSASKSAPESQRNAEAGVDSKVNENEVAIESPAEDTVQIRTEAAEGETNIATGSGTRGESWPESKNRLRAVVSEE